MTFGRRHTFFALSFVAALASTVTGCATRDADSSEQSYGRVGVQVSALTESSRITAVVLESGTAQATLTFNQDKRRFEGSLILPPGQHHLVGKAFAGTDQVGLGSADVTIEANQTSAVKLRILDTTGGPTQADAGPFIYSLTSSANSGNVGQPITFAASAVDTNGDALSYAWTSTCAGSFDTQAASTTWIPAATGSCHITATATSNGLTDSESIDIFVFEASNTAGAAAVEAQCFPSPYISGLTAGPCSIYSSNTDSMCRTPLTAGSPGGLYVSYSASGAATIEVTDNCGGTARNLGAPYYFEYTPGQGPCILTVKITADGMSSSFSMSYYGK